MFQNNGFQGFQSGNEYGVRAQFVASDILVAESDLAFAAFQTQFALAQPVGFSPYALFQVGDHEYKRAFFKGEITSDGTSVPSIDLLKVQVDVPDVFAAGTEVIDGTGTKTFTFGRTFYEIPEVICSMKGGAVFAIPRVSNVTKTGCTVELRDSAGAAMGGTITWSAHGY